MLRGAKRPDSQYKWCIWGGAEGGGQAVTVSGFSVTVFCFKNSNFGTFMFFILWPRFSAGVVFVFVMTFLRFLCRNCWSIWACYVVPGCLRFFLLFLHCYLFFYYQISNNTFFAIFFCPKMQVPICIGWASFLLLLLLCCIRLDVIGIVPSTEHFFCRFCCLNNLILVNQYS